MDFSVLHENLEKMGYTVHEFETKEAAAEYLCSTIEGKTIGFGGSMTLKEMGLFEKLSEKNKVYWHWMPEEGKTGADAIRSAMTADLYFSSVNGISQKGEIVNIDGNSNRIAGTLYGHEKDYFVVGKNKVAENLEQAIYRARNTASPLNAKRLNANTPCAKEGNKCYDCNSPGRICRELSILWKKSNGCDYEVILVQEDLGY